MESPRFCPPGAALLARLLCAALVSLCALVLSACGPTQSTILINEAEVAFEKADLNKGAEKAPYEYFSAKEYLQKAKEEWGYSDFEAALDYAILSRKFAEEAVRKAKGKPGKAPAQSDPSQIRDPEADALE